MTEKFWFNRMVEHWTAPTRLDLVEHVRRAGLQVVQIGNFGPQFYSLADDPEVERSWVGMPLVGLRENLEYMAELIPRLQEAGARVVGQMSMAWHYGDHEKGKGLFGVWEQIWTDELLGKAPCTEASAAMQRLADGSLRCWPIEGRPYRTYSGCVCNPHWLATFKPMVGKAIELGVEGFNVHHNFENFCSCSHCHHYLSAHLQEIFSNAELRQIFGTEELEEVADVSSPGPQCPLELQPRFKLAVNRAIQVRRKQAFDEIFIAHGRSIKPDLILAQWYHKYDFEGADERSLLPTDLWARDEDYIWYSQGGHKNISYIEHGHLGDMGLPARFVYAAGGGRPFVLNKYDSRRWRLSIAEAAANHFAALAYHWTQDGNANFALEDYSGPVLRYQRFLANHQALVHPARPWAQIALVYPRRAELEAEIGCIDALKRIGRLLEDRHRLFDIILDEQLVERASEYDMLILPEVERLSPEEGALLRQFVEAGGKLVFTGETGKCQVDGTAHAANLLAAWQVQPAAGKCAGYVQAGQGRVLYIPEGPWEADRIEVEKGGHNVTELRVYPLFEQDAFGRALLQELEGLLEPVFLETNAPWFVRVRAWFSEQKEALVLHWVNYQQDEQAAIEVPVPVGPLQVECAVPQGYVVERVEWLYPEMGEPVLLDCESSGARSRFEIPGLIVYGMSVLYLRRA